MKNKKTKEIKSITLFIVIAVILLGLVCIFKVYNSKPLKTDNLEILVTDSYVNYAWGYTYNGTAIFNDGSIYDWSYNDEPLPDQSLEERAEWIKMVGVERDSRVKTRDINKLLKLIPNLKNRMKVKYVGADQGSFSIEVWNYKKKSQIPILQSGDSKGRNNTKESKKIIKIVSKYTNIKKYEK